MSALAGFVFFFFNSVGFGFLSFCPYLYDHISVGSLKYLFLRAKNIGFLGVLAYPACF